MYVAVLARQYSLPISAAWGYLGIRLGDACVGIEAFFHGREVANQRPGFVGAHVEFRHAQHGRSRRLGWVQRELEQPTGLSAPALPLSNGGADGPGSR